jgi:RNA polymerase sigma-70 factor (ECF subfamily)
MASTQHPGGTPDVDARIARAIARRRYPRALELLVRSYGPAIGRLCRAMVGDPAEAEELTQEILLAAHEAMPDFAARSTVRTWLYAIARRSCSRHLRQRRRRAQLIGARPPQAPPDPPDPLQQVIARRDGQRLRQAMDELGPGERDALLLRFCAGLSFREVAEACGIREEAARQRACSALRRLRERLTRVPAAPVLALSQEVSR